MLPESQKGMDIILYNLTMSDGSVVSAVAELTMNKLNILPDHTLSIIREQFVLAPFCRWKSRAKYLFEIILYSKNGICLLEYLPVRLIHKLKLFTLKTFKIKNYNEKNNRFKHSVPDGRMCDDNQ